MKGDAPLTTWTNDELNKVGTAEELKIASLRRDGTLRQPGDDLGRPLRRRPLRPIR